MKNSSTFYIYIAVLLIAAASIPACSSGRQSTASNISYESFKRRIPVPGPSDKERVKFNADAEGKKVELKDEKGNPVTGYVTSNREFLEEVIVPALKPYLNELRSMSKAEMISTLALFGHELYQKYFGKDFYRWGGDLLDLDDPQTNSFRYSKKYGLDCSGYSTMAYELAVYLDLLKPEEAVFSSKGLELYCKASNYKDGGARDGGSNRFRPDTKELSETGKEIFVVKKGSKPTDEQIALLQPGDLAGRNGHFGIIVQINGEPFYLESGGWVVPNNGGNPCRAADALRIFARNGDVHIRRTLPDIKTAGK